MNTKIKTILLNGTELYVNIYKEHYYFAAPFYEMEDNSVVTIFKYKEIHQSYPERVHGGLITAMLDELGLRALWPIEPNCWGVTFDLQTKAAHSFIHL